MKTHYIAMSGIGGCLPSSCDVHETLKEAVESLKQFYELSQRQVKELKKFRIVDLRKDQGNEYAEIMECKCNEPGEHQDETSVEDFKSENLSFYEEEEEENVC